MPAKPLPLKTTEPKRPPGIPDGLWNFPRNLADEGNAAGWFQHDVAEKAGVSQSTVSRWLHYEVASLTVLQVMMLEQALNLAHGELTLPTTVLRARRRKVDVVAHESVPAGAVDDLHRIAEVNAKEGRQPRRGARTKRG